MKKIKPAAEPASNPAPTVPAAPAAAVAAKGAAINPPYTPTLADFLMLNALGFSDDEANELLDATKGLANRKMPPNGWDKMNKIMTSHSKTPIFWPAKSFTRDRGRVILALLRDLPHDKIIDGNGDPLTKTIEPEWLVQWLVDAQSESIKGYDDKKLVTAPFFLNLVDYYDRIPRWKRPGKTGSDINPVARTTAEPTTPVKPTPPAAKLAPVALKPTQPPQPPSAKQQITGPDMAERFDKLRSAMDAVLYAATARLPLACSVDILTLLALGMPQDAVFKIVNATYGQKFPALLSDIKDFNAHVIGILTSIYVRIDPCSYLRKNKFRCFIPVGIMQWCSNNNRHSARILLAACNAIHGEREWPREFPIDAAARGDLKNAAQSAYEYALEIQRERTTPTQQPTVFAPKTIVAPPPSREPESVIDKNLPGWIRANVRAARSLADQPLFDDKVAAMIVDLVNDGIVSRHVITSTFVSNYGLKPHPYLQNADLAKKTAIHIMGHIFGIANTRFDGHSLKAENGGIKLLLTQRHHAAIDANRTLPVIKNDFVPVSGLNAHKATRRTPPKPQKVRE